MNAIAYMHDMRAYCDYHTMAHSREIANAIPMPATQAGGQQYIAAADVVFAHIKAAFMAGRESMRKELEDAK